MGRRFLEGSKILLKVSCCKIRIRKLNWNIKVIYFYVKMDFYCFEREI